MAFERPVAPPSKPRWSELEEEDNVEDLSFLLPPRQVIGPDKNGIKKVIEYKFNEKGEMVKVTTTTRVRKFVLTKGAVERRSWPKFGDAVNEDVGSRLTIVSTEEIFLERPKAEGSEVESTSDSLSQLNKSAPLVICRTCGKKGDHWTARCPYKDLTSPPEDSINWPSSADNTTTPSDTKKNIYIPPSMRAGGQKGGRSDMIHKNDENSVRVSCLSEDTCESDLRELFGRFGPLTRAYVSTDRHTGLSRGFGFVNFVNKEDAQRAIEKLDGYGYDNLIIHVEWSNQDGTRRRKF